MPWVMEPAHDRKSPFAKHHIDRRDRRAAVRCGRLAAMAAAWVFLATSAILGTAA
jgi:hypothetical protein